MKNPLRLSVALIVASFLAGGVAWLATSGRGDDSSRGSTDHQPIEVPYGSSLIAFDDRVLIIGGDTNGRRVSEAIVFDPSTGIAKKTDPTPFAPPPRVPAVVAFERQAIAVGFACTGWVDEEGCEPGRYASARLDIDTGEWRELPSPATRSTAVEGGPIPVGATSKHAVFALGSLGGRELWALDTSDWQWQALDTPTSVVDACVQGDEVWALSVRWRNGREISEANPHGPNGYRDAARLPDDGFVQPRIDRLRLAATDGRWATGESPRFDAWLGILEPQLHCVASTGLVVPADPNAAPLSLLYAPSFNASTWGVIERGGSTLDAVVESSPMPDGRLLLVAGVPARLVMFDPADRSLVDFDGYPVSPDTSGVASVGDVIVVASLGEEGTTQVSILPTNGERPAERTTSSYRTRTGIWRGPRTWPVEKVTSASSTSSNSG